MNDNINMAPRYEREIPEGYEARIEGNKVIFELEESEDERIRKGILALVKKHAVNHERCQMEAYLEKQKEQKPILEVSGFKVGDAVRLKDGDGRKHIIKSFEEVEGLHGRNFYCVKFEDNSATDIIYPGEKYPNGYYTHMAKFEEEQNAAEWSEEDEKFFKTALWHISYSVSNGKSTNDHCDTTDWLKGIKERLKSLRPLPHWKPSEEQIKALKHCVNGWQDTADGTLESLYNDLKKL